MLINQIIKEDKDKNAINVYKFDLTPDGHFKINYPEEVLGEFSCANLDTLISLKGSPKIVHGSFTCHFCSTLPSLEGGPEFVRNSFYSFGTAIKNLHGAPKKVLWNFDCSSTKSLVSLEGAPDYIGENFNCCGTNIETLKGIGRSYLKECHGKILLPGDTIKSNILGLLLIKHLTWISFNDTIENNEAPKILVRHFNKNKDVLECQEELISAGYKEFAKL